MKMVILESNDIESSEGFAKELLGSKESINKKNNTTLVASNKAYVLNFDKNKNITVFNIEIKNCLLYTSPSPRDVEESRMPSSA